MRGVSVVLALASLAAISGCSTEPNGPVAESAVELPEDYLLVKLDVPNMT